MKTNPGSSAGRELSSINSSKTSTLPSKLKELKGSFALEGIEIPDERVLRYEAEFQNAKKTGRVRADIERAIRDIPE